MSIFFTSVICIVGAIYLILANISWASRYRRMDDLLDQEFIWTSNGLNMKVIYIDPDTAEVLFACGDKKFKTTLKIWDSWMSEGKIERR